MNIITFDIEEWYQELAMYGGRKEKYFLYDSILNDLLLYLDEKNIKATFFCVGKMAQYFPYVIEKIQSCGHEIGCHSNEHKWLNKMTKQDIIVDTKEAIDRLEQLLSEKIICYRAPAFTINENNIWIYELFVSLGIKIDSSIFPLKHEIGGFQNFPITKPCIIDYSGVKIKEFPINPVRYFNKKIIFSGGGYFRLYPFFFIKRSILKNNYNMIYFHLNDISPTMPNILSKSEYEMYFHEKGTLLKCFKRYIKTNVGINGALIKLKKIIQEFDFQNICQANNKINWDDAITVKL